MMLQILETGKALYALIMIGFAAIFSRVIVRNLYRRLIKETDNITITKNRYLRELKQKAENTYRLNQGMVNVKTYLEKQLYSYHFAGISLNGWSNLTGQMTFLCYLMGILGAFLSYWYRLDTSYIVLYGAVGVMMGLFTMFIDGGINLAEKQKQLITMLQDYFENNLYQKISIETINSRSNRKNRQFNDIPIVGDDEKVDSGSERKYKAGNTELNSARVKEAAKRLAISHAAAQGMNKTDETDPEQPVEYLKKSLEQIAASREKKKTGADWLKDLSQEELQLIGEIFREYLT